MTFNNINRTETKSISSLDRGLKIASALYDAAVDFGVYTLVNQVASHALPPKSKFTTKVGMFIGISVVTGIIVDKHGEIKNKRAEEISYLLAALYNKYKIEQEVKDGRE